MSVFKKKKRVDTPDSLIQQADSIVEAQKAQFREIAQKVADAMEQRTNAINELGKEKEALRAKQERVENMISQESDKIKADSAYHDRVQDFIN